MPEERLQKIISNAGRASRRVAERWIADGRVTVNGSVVRAAGSRADPDRDEITVDGVPLRTSVYRYFALHKPRGVLTSARDDRGRPTVLDLVPIGDITLHPVGRLDLDSEGLVILTNDGNLTNLLTHPRHQVEKEYLVAVNRPLTRPEIRRAARGVQSDGEHLRWISARPVLPAAGNLEGLPDSAGWLVVILRRGRKREIRRILEALGHSVLLLRRIRIGPLGLGTLGSGAFRELEEAEVESLYAAASRTTAPPPSGGREIRARAPRLPWNIAIDGPAAAGKTAVGTALAERYGYHLLDTGLMYRAFAYAALKRRVPPSEDACRALARSLDMKVRVKHDTRIFLAGEDVTAHLRDPDVEEAVSSYSAVRSVRRFMVRKQRAIAAASRAVVVGRDIGTVVLPQAPVKIYLEASEEARARRRKLQFGADVGPHADGRLQRNIARRDALDSTRSASPLRAAEDAVRIDTTGLTLEQVIERVDEEVRCAAG